MPRKADQIPPELGEDEDDLQVEDSFEGLVPAAGVDDDPEFDRVLNIPD